MEIMDIIAIVLTVAGIGAFVYLLPEIKAFIPKLTAWFMAHTTAEQRKILYDLAKQVVHSAEQLFGAGRGEEKKAYAMKLMELLFPDTSEDVREAAVEDQVYQMNAEKDE